MHCVEVPGLEAQTAGHGGRYAGQWHRPDDGMVCLGPGCEGPCLVWLQNRRLGHDYGEGPGEDTDDVEWVVDKQKPTCNEIYVLSPFSSQIMRASAK